ncbi:MAG: hypothetical protein KDA68_04210 [Planctomycetaceae bacterium]|nr:hypothetical protein [Planctomycetaceae bacterium]
MEQFESESQSSCDSNQAVVVIEGEFQLGTSPSSPQRQIRSMLPAVSSNLRWNEFLQRHGDWYATRQDEGEFVYPLQVDENLKLQFRNLFQVGESELIAERDYFEICRVHHAITWQNGLPLISPLMASCVDRQQCAGSIDAMQELGRSIGWTNRQVEAVSTLMSHGDDARERTQSIAGRWICHPEYRTQLASLRQQWIQLSYNERPLFPLQRASPPENRALHTDLFRSPELDEFVHQLIAFLDRWQLMQLTTWEIAEPQGIQMIAPDGVVAGELRNRNPVAFPLQVQDGVSNEYVSFHEHLARGRGIDDLSRFDTYRQIWRIDFLENLLHRRYDSTNQVRGFQTKVQGFIAEYIELHVDRIKKYRGWRNRFRKGEITSLNGLS